MTVVWTVTEKGEEICSVQINQGFIDDMKEMRGWWSVVCFVAGFVIGAVLVEFLK